LNTIFITARCYTERDLLPQEDVWLSVRLSVSPFVCNGGRWWSRNWDCRKV